MKKDTALHHILKFGRKEQIELIKAGHDSDAYQIEHARTILLYALNKSIKRVREVLVEMTSYTIDEKGIWHYEMQFVADELTRNLLIQLSKEFNN